MKALYFNEHGTIDVIKYGEVDDPKVKEGEVLIKVKAVALNHLDIWIRRGWLGLKLDMPHITGADVSGVLEEVPAGIKGFKVGDRVAVFPGIVTEEDSWVRANLESLSPSYSVLGEHRKGGLAEYLAVPIRNIFHIPNHQSFEDAAAPNLVATTVWRMLFGQGKLEAGETVLVVGSGGGVNSLAVQIAKAKGARVICLAGSGEKADRIKELGATDVVNYSEVTDWHRAVLSLTAGFGVDLVVDNVGEATFLKSLKSLRRGGRLVTVGNTSGYNLSIDNRIIFTRQLSVIGSTMGSQQDLIQCLKFMSDNQLKVAIDSVNDLVDGKQAMSRLERGDHFGKILLRT